MQATGEVSSTDRLDYLDSARGIAAMMVMYFHFLVMHYNSFTWTHYAYCIINGTEAVSFFFVLSGFVLSYKYLVRGKEMDIRSFYINRIFRIWPAFFITVLLNALYANRHDLSLAALSDLFFHAKQQFWQEALLIRGTPKFYPPGWTLSIELAISFFMPFAILLARRNRNIVFWLLVAVLLEGNTKMSVFHFHFALGLLLCCYYNELRSEAFKQTVWYRWRYAILPAAYLLWCIRHISVIHPFGQIFEDVTDYLQLGFYFMSGLASFIFIGAFIYSNAAQRILHSKVLVFAGRVSYGLYLAHSLVGSLIFDHWDWIKGHFASEAMAAAIALIAFTALTFLMATLFYYFIELPFIRIGKKISARYRPAYVQ